MTILQNDFDRERIPVRRLAWYENVKRREKKKKIYFLKNLSQLQLSYKENHLILRASGGRH